MAVGRINGVAALTGFYYKKMYGHFAWTEKSGRNNKVAVLMRCPLGGVPLKYSYSLMLYRNWDKPAPASVGHLARIFRFLIIKFRISSLLFYHWWRRPSARKDTLRGFR